MENVDFSLKSIYDDAAYHAMAKATWKLFQKHRMEVMAYPALFSIAVLIAVILVYNWESCTTALRIGGICFVILQFAVIPLGAWRAQQKNFRKAVRDAKSRGSYPAEVSFLFKGNSIHATVDGSTAVMEYRDVVRLGALKEWRLIYFSQGAYIIPTQAFASQEELACFDQYLSEKCRMPIDILEGKRPQAAA